MRSLCEKMSLERRYNGESTGAGLSLVGLLLRICWLCPLLWLLP